MRAFLLCMLALSLLGGVGHSLTLSARTDDGVITYTIGGQGVESFTVVVKKDTKQIAVEHLDSITLPYEKKFIAVEEGLYEISVIGKNEVKKIQIYSEAFKEPDFDLSKKETAGAALSQEMLLIGGLILFLVVAIAIISLAEKKGKG